MRIAVVSDIHGNLIALDAVLDDVARQSPDEIWCGGDIAWGGPWPADCVDRVRSEGWPTVKGNTDVWITGDPQTIEPEDSRAELTLLAEAHGIGDDDARWLSQLPVGHTGSGSILLVHGTPDSPFAAPLPSASPSEFRMFEARAQLVIYGHVHRAFVRRLAAGTIVANPGSVGLPKDDETASYLVVDVDGPDLTLSHRRVAFDRAAARAEAERRDDAVGRFFLQNFGTDGR